MSRNNQFSTDTHSFTRSKTISFGNQPTDNFHRTQRLEKEDIQKVLTVIHKNIQKKTPKKKERKKGRESKPRIVKEKRQIMGKAAPDFTQAPIKPGKLTNSKSPKKARRKRPQTLNLSQGSRKRVLVVPESVSVPLDQQAISEEQIQIELKKLLDEWGIDPAKRQIIEGLSLEKKRRFLAMHQDEEDNEVEKSGMKTDHYLISPRHVQKKGFTRQNNLPQRPLSMKMKSKSFSNVLRHHDSQLVSSPQNLVINIDLLDNKKQLMGMNDNNQQQDIPDIPLDDDIDNLDPLDNMNSNENSQKSFMNYRTITSVSSDKMLTWMTMYSKMYKFFSQQCMKKMKLLIGIKGIALFYYVLSRLPETPFSFSKDSANGEDIPPLNNLGEQTKHKKRVEILKTLINLAKNSTFFSELATKADPALLNLEIETLITPVVIPLCLFDILRSYVSSKRKPQFPRIVDRQMDLNEIVELVRADSTPKDIQMYSLILLGRIATVIQSLHMNLDPDFCDSLKSFVSSLSDNSKRRLEFFDFDFDLFDKKESFDLENLAQINWSKRKTKETKKKQEKIIEETKRFTLQIKLPDGVVEAFLGQETTTAGEIIREFARRYRISQEIYGLFGSFEDGEWAKEEAPNPTIARNISIQILDASFLIDGDFIPNDSLISAYRDKQIQIRKLPPDNLDIILPPDPKDLQPRHVTFPVNTLVSTVLAKLCFELHASKQEYGLLLKIPKKVSRSELDGSFKSGIESTYEIQHVSFVPVEKNQQFGKAYPTLSADNAFGIWMEERKKRKLSSYVSQYHVGGYIFAKFQPRPGKINIIYPSIDKQTGEKTQKEEQLMVDFTTQIKILINEFCRIFLGLRSAKKFSVFQVIYGYDDLSEYDLTNEPNPYSQKRHNENTKEKGKQILELILLSDDLPLCLQEIKVGDTLKLITNIQESLETPIKPSVSFTSLNSIVEDANGLRRSQTNQIGNNNNNNDNNNNNNLNPNENELQLEVVDIDKKNNSNNPQEENIDIDFEMNFSETNPDLIPFWDSYKGKGIVLVLEQDTETQNNDPLDETFSVERIKALSLNKLVEIVTSPSTIMGEFLDMFIELLPTITDDETFLQKMFERFEVPDTHPQNGNMFSAHEKRRIQSSVIRVIYRFCKSSLNKISHEVKSMIQNFATNILVTHNDRRFQQRGHQLLQLIRNGGKEETKQENFPEEIKDNGNFDKKEKCCQPKRSQKGAPQKTGPMKMVRIKEDEDFSSEDGIETNKNGGLFRQEIYIKDFPNWKPKVPKITSLEKLGFEDISPDEAARQLTSITFGYFSKIQTKELLNISWAKRSKKTLSPNIISMVEWFNHLATFVTCVILRYEKLKPRAKIMSRLIELTEQLILLRNYNDAMAVISGLQHVTVDRLTRSWELVPQKAMTKFYDLDNLTGAIGGFKTMRNELKKSPRPALPYLGLYLSDLTKIEELPSRIADSLIFWTKRRRMYRVIKELKSFQSVSYEFPQVPLIQSFFSSDSFIITESQMWELSLQFQSD